MTLEDSEPGWRNFEWRWRAPTERPFVRECAAALWLGDEAISGKRLLIQSEQGLGDTLQFIRYAAQLADQGAQVFVDAPAALKSILSRVEGVFQVISPDEDLPAVDFRCPMMSLPHALRLATPLGAGTQGYLTVHPDALRKWEDRFGPGDRPLVGLAYAGNAKHTNDLNRSIRLDELLPHLPRGPRYVVLQTELRDGDAALMSTRHDVEWMGPEFRDFMDTAAASTRLDLIVTVDTAIAHLAGAIGRPTLLLLPFEPDWRWGFDRKNSLWYPSVTLLRQVRRGDWSDPLQVVTDVITTLAEENREFEGDATTE